jgi:glycosyltransferase involved in cell wall biosynthesis
VEAQSSQLASHLAFVEPTHVSPLRVVLDGRKLGDGGIGVYIDNTVRGLLERGDVDLTIIAKPGQSDGVPWKREVAWLYDNARPYSMAEYLLLGRRIDSSAYDLFHSPHYTLPFGIRIPTIVTIHDLIHIEHPERAFYPLIARRLIRSAVKRASAIIVVSEDTKRALKVCMGAGNLDVHVIPNSIPAIMCAEGNDMSVPDLPGLHSATPYFVAVLSNLKPHKGVKELLQAYASLRTRLRAERNSIACPQLLLVGHGAQALKERPSARGVYGLSDGVSVVGSVKSHVLKNLYRGAEALVVASRAEGFCFPALEAQSVGTRVVCTPVPALLEFVTDRDLVARDFSSSALAEVLYQAAAAPRAERVIQVSHLERFAPERVSAQIGALYNRVVAANRLKRLEAR